MQTADQAARERAVGTRPPRREAKYCSVGARAGRSSGDGGIAESYPRTLVYAVVIQSAGASVKLIDSRGTFLAMHWVSP
jgi:hypothetical protein